MKRYGIRISIRDTQKWVAGTILAIYDLSDPKQKCDFRSTHWGDGRWLYLEVDFTDEEADLAQRQMLKIDLMKLIPGDVAIQRGIANRVNAHHDEIHDKVFAHVNTLSRLEDRQIYAMGLKPNVDKLKTKTGDWRTVYDPVRKEEMKRKLIKGTDAIQNAVASKVEEREDLTLPEKLAAIRFHKNIYVGHKDQESEKYRTMSTAGIWIELEAKVHVACRHFRTMIRDIEDRAKADIKLMDAKPEILKVFTGKDFEFTPKAQHVAGVDLGEVDKGFALPGVGILGVLIMLMVFLFSFHCPAIGSTPKPLDKYSTLTRWADEGLNPYDPVWTVGDGKTYSTIQAGINGIPGGLTTVQTVEVYAKAPSNEYAEATINWYSGFSGMAADKYVHLVAMIDHLGVEGAGIKIHPPSSTYQALIYSTYSRFEGFEVGNWHHPFCNIRIWSPGHLTNVTNARMWNCLLHDVTCGNRGEVHGAWVAADCLVYNCIISDLRVYSDSPPTSTIGIYLVNPGAQAYNNTVFHIYKSNSGTPVGIYFTANTTAINNYCGGNDPEVYAFRWASTVGVTNDYNISSDGTATGNGGTGNQINKAPGDQFTNTSIPDFTLKTGSDCIDAGTDLSALYSGAISTDIAGIARGWSVGAHTIGATGVSVGPYEHQAFASPYEPGAWR